MANKDKDWIQGVTAEMKKKGTVGAFTKQAKNHGMSVHDFATKVMSNPEDFSKRTRERANLALTFEKIAKDKKKMMYGGKTKMAHGGKTQGYNDKLDESLGVRTGTGSMSKQTYKDRRDESKAGNKMLGRRAYASVESMDKGDRMMMEGGKMKMAHGGRMKQGYDAREDESLGMRTGKQSSKKVSAKGRRDDSYGKFGKRDEEDRDITLAKGGKLSAKAVKEGYIRRDRYDKLKKEKDEKIDDLKQDLKDKGADCAEDIKTMKKDIGKKVAKRIDQVEKKVAKEKDEQCDDLTERINDECEQDIYKGDDRREKEKTESLILGGIGGLLLGMFLGR